MPFKTTRVPGNRKWMGSALLLLACVAHAADPRPLDEEFLEYLAQLEGGETNWTWFVSDAKTRQSRDPPPRKPPPDAEKAPENDAEKVKP